MFVENSKLLVKASNKRLQFQNYNCGPNAVTIFLDAEIIVDLYKVGQNQ